MGRTRAHCILHRTGLPCFQVYHSVTHTVEHPSHRCGTLNHGDYADAFPRPRRPPSAAGAGAGAGAGVRPPTDAGGAATGMAGAAAAAEAPDAPSSSFKRLRRRMRWLPGGAAPASPPCLRFLKAYSYLHNHMAR